MKVSFGSLPGTLYDTPDGHFLLVTGLTHTTPDPLFLTWWGWGPSVVEVAHSQGRSSEKRLRSQVKDATVVNRKVSEVPP